MNTFKYSIYCNFRYPFSSITFCICTQWPAENSMVCWLWVSPQIFFIYLYYKAWQKGKYLQYQVFRKVSWPTGNVVLWHFNFKFKILIQDYFGSFLLFCYFSVCSVHFITAQKMHDTRYKFTKRNFTGLPQNLPTNINPKEAKNFENGLEAKNFANNISNFNIWRTKKRWKAILILHKKEWQKFAPGEARTHGLQIMRLTRCLLRYGGQVLFIGIKPKTKNRQKKKIPRNASAGNRTRVNCLEGSYAHHYTNIALLYIGVVTLTLIFLI